MGNPMGKEFRNLKDLKGHALLEGGKEEEEGEKKEESWRRKEGMMGRS